MTLLPDRFFPTRRGRRFPPALLLLTLSACAVGPDFHRPAMPGPAVPRYTEAVLPDATGTQPIDAGARQRFVNGRDIPGEWWQLFRSPVITALVERALRDNPNVEAAQASLRQAQEQRLQQEGTLFPNVSGSVLRSRGETPGVLSGFQGTDFTQSYYGAQLSLSYTLDVWGALRRAVEQTAARVEFERFQLEAVDLALAAGVATSAVDAASLAGQIKVQKELIGFETRQLETVKRQFELGGATGTDVAIQEAQVATARTVLVPLQTSLAQTRDQLAAYLGIAPSELDLRGPGLPAFSLPELSLDDITLPGELPVSLPASLLDQRPDIREAEATLHQQSALLGVAIAQRLPNVTLTAQVGSDAADTHQLFSPGNGLWSLVNQAVQPVFDAGQLLHAQRAQRAALENAAASWRNTVVTAFQNVSDVLVSLQNDELALAASLDDQRASERSLSLASLQYKLGGVSYLTVLTAQQSTQNAILSLLQARARRYTDSIALYQALGGGWWHRRDQPAPPPGLLSSPLP
jgi:NodT family efflux transporter outer membrane factor (OMF) lipoprotein